MTTRREDIGVDGLMADEQEPAEVQGRLTGRTSPKSIDDLLRRPSKQRSRVAFWPASAWIVLVGLAAMFADLLPLQPYDVIIDDLPPRSAPRLSFSEPLGTDALGRSTISRVIFGARQSLIVGVVSTGISMTAGMSIGMAAAYFRGKVDAFIRVLLDAMLSVPALVLLLAVAAIGKRDITTVVIGLSIVLIPTFARLARANTLALVVREYVAAARVMGAGHLRILLRELLPNVLLPISSYSFLVIAVAIVAEGSLSFLGLGIPPPTPSWGGMVDAARPYLQSDPFLVFAPAACLVLTVLSFTVVGDRARRHFDTRQSALA
jgi:peptide/nickel transport system permease protein